MRGKTLVFAIITALFLVSSATPVFAHYFLGYSSVDGRVIDWRDYTKYDDPRQTALNQWSLGRVTLRQWDPNGFSIADLDFGDYNDCNDTRTGYYSTWQQPDKIYFNSCQLDKSHVTSSMRRNTASHELGHALGLAHNPDSTQVMYGSQTSIVVPQAHDKQDYYELWP